MSEGQLTNPALDLLATGEIEVLGRMPWSSNATLLVEVSREATRMRAIYKPRQGERPLWDFPPGLDRREVAAYELDCALGWGLVPETVLRDGPHGVGSVQRFVDAQFDDHYMTLVESGCHDDRLMAMCAFDLLANNTDRKSGHCLLSLGGQIVGIDHGLCFHSEFKLRTVIWDFAGQPIPGQLMADIDRFLAADGVERLGSLLSPAEVDALADRAADVLGRGAFPVDHTGRRFPWPLV